MLCFVTIWWLVFTACGFVRLHGFCWISDKGNVTFCAVSVHVAFDCIAVPECQCKQCGFVRQKMNTNASTTRMY